MLILNLSVFSNIVEFMELELVSLEIINFNFQM